MKPDLREAPEVDRLQRLVAFGDETIIEKPVEKKRGGRVGRQRKR